MRLFLLVRLLVFSSYRERHIVRLSYPMDGLTDLHVSSPSLVCTGIILCLYHLILLMVRQPSTWRTRHLVYVTVGIFVFPYVRTTSTHPCTTVWFSLSTSFSHPCTTVWLSVGVAWAIYIYIDKFYLWWCGGWCFVKQYPIFWHTGFQYTDKSFWFNLSFIQ